MLRFRSNKYIYIDEKGSSDGTGVDGNGLDKEVVHCKKEDIKKIILFR